MDLAYTPVSISLSTPSFRSSDTSSDSSSPISSSEVLDCLFELEQSQKEKRNARKELRRKTKANEFGAARVRERLALLKEEEEFGFCFGWEDEEVFCGSESGGSGSEDEGSTDNEGEVDDSEEEEEYQKTTNSVRWKDDEHLIEIINPPQNEDLIVGQEPESIESDTRTVNPRLLELPHVPTKPPPYEPTYHEPAFTIESEALLRNCGYSQHNKSHSSKITRFPQYLRSRLRVLLLNCDENFY
jgi:hypothetical protein